MALICGICERAIAVTVTDRPYEQGVKGTIAVPACGACASTIRFTGVMLCRQKCSENAQNVKEESPKQTAANTVNAEDGLKAFQK